MHFDVILKSQTLNPASCFSVEGGTGGILRHSWQASVAWSEGSVILILYSSTSLYLMSVNAKSCDESTALIYCTSNGSVSF